MLLTGAGPSGGGAPPTEPPVFNPLSLAPILWQDVTQMGLADMVAADSLPDYSGANNIWYPPSPSETAVHYVNGINGRPALLFDSVDDLYSGTHAGVSAYAMAVVWQPNSLADQLLYFDGYSNIMGIFGGVRHMENGNPALDNGTPDTAPQIWLMEGSASGRRFQVNSTVVSDSEPDSGLPNGGSAYLSYPFAISGWFGERMIVGRSITDAERTAWLGYLATKWGVTV